MEQIEVYKIFYQFKVHTQKEHDIISSSFTPRKHNEDHSNEVHEISRNLLWRVEKSTRNKSWKKKSASNQRRRKKRKCIYFQRFWRFEWTNRIFDSSSLLCTLKRALLPLSFGDFISRSFCFSFCCLSHLWIKKFPLKSSEYSRNFDSITN